MDPNRLHNTLPSNISSSSINGGSTNKNNLLSVNNSSGSTLGRSGLLHATSNGSWASSGNHRYNITRFHFTDLDLLNVDYHKRIELINFYSFQPLITWIRKIWSLPRTSCISRRYLSYFWFRQKSKRVGLDWGKCRVVKSNVIMNLIPFNVIII